MQMNELTLSLCCAGGALITYLACVALKNKNIHLGKKEVAWSDILLRSLALLLFAAMIPYLFWMNEMSNQLGLEGEMFSKAGYVLIGVLDWLTVLTIAVTIVMPFFAKKQPRD